MVKTIYNLAPAGAPDLGTHPPPPPLPRYDPKEEAPRWDLYRLWNHLPKPERHPDTPPRVGGHAESDDKPDWRGIIAQNVIPLPKVEPYDFGRPQDPKYFFFDTPDYADPFKKLWYSFKFFTVSGIGLASLWGIVQGRPFTFEDNRILLTRYTLPWLAGGMVFSSAVVTVANMRGNKDGMLNYFIAGLVTGCATGKNNYLQHMRHTIGWTSAGMFTKYNAETNGCMTLRVSPYSRSSGMSGFSAEGGLWTGNLHFLKGKPNGDPGRETRRFAL